MWCSKQVSLVNQKGGAQAADIRIFFNCNYIINRLVGYKHVIHPLITQNTKIRLFKNWIEQPIPAIYFSTHADSSLTNRQSFIKSSDIGKIMNFWSKIYMQYCINWQQVAYIASKIWKKYFKPYVFDVTKQIGSCSLE